MKNESSHLRSVNWQPIRLGFMLAVLLVLGLTLWITPSSTKAQQGGGGSGSQQENTNCEVSSVTTNCSGGSVTLIAPTNTPSVCIGSGVNISVTSSNILGQQVIDTSYSNCPDSYQTNSVSPTVVSSTWTVSGVGATPSSGSGLSASFTPTGCGNGSVSFSTTYQDGCDSNNQTASTSAGFNVVAVTSLTPSAGQWVDDGDGDSNTDTYLVQYGCYDTITVTAGDCPGLSEPNLPSCWQMSGGTGSGKLQRTVDGNTVGTTTIKATCGTSSKTITIIVYQAKFEIYADEGSCSLSDVGHAWWNLSITPSAAETFLNNSGCLGLAGYFDHCEPTGPGEVIFGTQTDQCSSDHPVHNASGSYWWCISFNGLQNALNYVEDLATTGSTYDVTSNNCTTQAEAIEGVAGAPAVYSGIIPCGLSIALNLYAGSNGAPQCLCGN